MHRISSILLVCLLLAGAFHAFAQNKEDDRIYDQVRLRLASNAEVKGAAIEVKVQDGVVTLLGKVRSDKAKQKAESLTHKIKGVKKVVNQLQISAV
jgi:osmotically-inducible protein OsmY